MSNFEDFHNTIIEHVYANFHNGNVKINPLFKIWLDFFNISLCERQIFYKNP